MTVDLDRAKEELVDLVSRTAQSHHPILITRADENAVLLREEDWLAVQETLHLLGTPGMRESIRESLATSVRDCSEDSGW